MDGHRGVLKRGLTHRNFVHADIVEPRFSSEDHGKDRRTPIQRRQITGQVRRIAVRKQQNARDRLAAPAIHRHSQRGAKRRGAPVEIQAAEIPRVLQTRVEGVTAHLESPLQRGLPALGVSGQLLAQKFASRAQLARVFHLQALAVVGDQGEDVGAGSRALADPQRFQQAQRERARARQFERSANDGYPALRRVAPGSPDQRPR